MPWLPPINDHLKHMLSVRQDTRARPWWWRSMRYVVRLVKMIVWKQSEDRAQEKAAALTYHTLFSLLPTIVLVLVVANVFVQPDDVEELKEQSVQYVMRFVQSSEAEAAGLGTESSVPEADTPRAEDGTVLEPAELERSGLFEPGRDAGPARPVWVVDERAGAEREARLAASAAAAADRRAEMRELLGSLEERLQALLDYLESVDVRSIGVVGVLFFFYGVTNLLATIEQNFNGILHARNNRPLRLRLPLYFTTIMLAPVVLGLGRYAQQEFEHLIEQSQYTSWIAAAVSNFWPLITTWLVLLLMYRLLPNAKVQTRAAAIGSFIAALLLSVTTWGFGLYVSTAAISSLYGALTLLPFGLLLVWTIWLIVIIGFEVAVCIQTLPRHLAVQARREAAVEQLADRITVELDQQLVEPRQLLSLMRYAATRFAGGETFTVDDLIEAVDLPPDAGQTMVTALVAANLLHAVGSVDEPSYTLARPPSAIALEQLLKVARALTGTVADDPALRPLRDAEEYAARQHTLADFVAA